MKWFFNGKFSYLLTFYFHWTFLDCIWTMLELGLYGQTKPSGEDSIIELLIVTYITFILGYKSK